MQRASKRSLQLHEITVVSYSMFLISVEILCESSAHWSCESRLYILEIQLKNTLKQVQTNIGHGVNQLCPKVASSPQGSVPEACPVNDLTGLYGRIHKLFLR